MQEAVALVKDVADAEAASRKLVQEAFGKGSSDNITCVVINNEMIWPGKNAVRKKITPQG
ncbi:hypothetical protein M569_09511 [Genlisea aurea]|uniref:PPM-type phosphatase domain-containing protein n=1 Tax=Genlisea aurea TaxID=192259 RepID=S8CE80_9LAMI|nr:hypothetical protein M569_09511 [Genlisea aurea]